MTKKKTQTDKKIREKAKKKTEKLWKEKLFEGCVSVLISFLFTFELYLLKQETHKNKFSSQVQYWEITKLPQNKQRKNIASEKNKEKYVGWIYKGWENYKKMQEGKGRYREQKIRWRKSVSNMQVKKKKKLYTNKVNDKQI